MIFIVLAIFFWFSKDLPFFWDAQIHSAHAMNFSFWAPSQMDFGHPPLFNFLLMGIWSLTGVKLWSAHLLSIIILLAIVLLWKKSPLFKTTPWWILFIEPILLSMTFQVSADLLLLFFYLLAIHFTHSNNKLGLSATLSLMALTSMRGILLIPSLILFVVYWKKPLKQWLFPFFIAFAISLTWLTAHYMHSGWLITPPSADQHRGISDVSQMIKNTVLVVWYSLDYGRWALWIGVAYILFKKKTKNTPPLFFIPFIFIAGFCIPLTNPFGERYFLIPFVLALFFVWKYISLYHKKQQLIFKIFITASMLSGHLWLYPSHISQNWDSTLAHIYFNKQQAQFEKDYLKSPTQISTSYPQTIPQEYTHLFTQMEYLDAFQCNSKNIQNYFWSPLQNNGFSDLLIQKLSKHPIHKEYGHSIWKSYWLRDVPCNWFNSPSS